MRVHSCIYNITANQIKESWNAASFSKCDFANVKTTPPSTVSGPPIHYICSGCHLTRKNLSEPNEVPAHIILSSPKISFAQMLKHMNAGEEQTIWKCSTIYGDEWKVVQKMCIQGVHPKQKVKYVTNFNLRSDLLNYTFANNYILYICCCIAATKHISKTGNKAGCMLIKLVRSVWDVNMTRGCPVVAQQVGIWHCLQNNFGCVIFAKFGLSFNPELVRA